MTRAKERLEAAIIQISEADHADQWAKDLAVYAMKCQVGALEAGMQGKELRIRIGGRMFAIRELAQ